VSLASLLFQSFSVSSFEDSYAHINSHFLAANYTFEAGHADYKFLENASWVGNGRFKVDEGKLGVEFRVSKVVSSTDMD
jgi:hypothetical protein